MDDKQKRYLSVGSKEYKEEQKERNHRLSKIVDSIKFKDGSSIVFKKGGDPMKGLYDE